MTSAPRDSGCRNCLALMVLLLLAVASQSQGQTSHLAAAYYNRGNERFRAGDLKGAIADYDAAITFKPRWAQAYNMRGTARYQKGDLDGSIADYTKAIEIDARLALAHYNRGKARRDKGDLDAALADYSRAIEINPRLSSAYNNRGNIKRERGDLDGAMADLDRAIQLNSSNAAFYNNRGLAWREKAELERAMADYDRAVKIEPKFAEAYSNRGNAKQDLGDLNGSISDYEAAISINPVFAKAYANRGLARLFKGDLVGAERDFDHCLKLEPKLKLELEEQIVRANRRLLIGADRFEIDPAHAFVTFTVSHFSGKAKGSFTDVSGLITYDEKDITKSSVEVVIKTASIHTGNQGRDAHLRSADFFDVAKFPEMTFKSKRVEKRGTGYVAVGDLTVRGVTKEVVMPFTFSGPIKDPLPSGVKRILVESSLKVDRRDFGITWSRVMPDGGLFVGNEVTLEINIEAIVPKPSTQKAQKPFL